MANPTTTQPTSGTTTQPTSGTGVVGEGMEDFAPIGVWVCNWADIFPWLATGYCHAIDDTNDAETMIKVRMMAQDFVTLSRLYHYAADLNLLIPNEPAFKAGDGSVCGQIADEFANAYGSLAGARDLAGAAQYKAAAAKAHNTSLGAVAKRIYEIWDRTPCLRSAELGLGYIKAGRSLKTRSWVHVGSGNTHRIPAEEFAYYELGECTFDVQNFSALGVANFAAFAQFYKVLPLILPQSGKIIAFGEHGFMGAGNLKYWDKFTTIKADGPDLMGGNIFVFRGGHREFDTHANRGLLPFGVSADTNPIDFVAKGNYLESTYYNVKLFPIPFSAAAGDIKWKGQSFSTNVKADADLNQRLAKIVEDLEAPSKKLWSWSSEPLASDWNGDKTYSREAVRKSVQYFGLSQKAAKIQIP